jgi:hypothetical protein
MSDRPHSATLKSIMASSAASAQEYWGYLIMPDKAPAPLLEQLLLGIANYIVSRHHARMGEKLSSV